MFTQTQIILAVTVFFARVVDVSLGTLRHAMIIRGKKGITMAIAFVEALVWVYAVSRVLADLSDPLAAVAFAAGFSCGTFTGMSIEGLLKIGEQAVRIFSSNGNGLAFTLREKGFRVTCFDGAGRDGKVVLLYVQARRRDVSKIVDFARTQDPACYVVVDDIRIASRGVSPTGK